MKCRNVVNGKCNNKIVNELNQQEDRSLKCNGKFSNETSIVSVQI